MTLILSGTNGLSDVDGSAATPAIRGTDANTGIFFPAADTIAFSEGGTEAMRIDSSGNVGIGTSSPKKRLTVSEASSASTTPGTNPVIWVGGGNVTANTLSEIGFIYGSNTWSESNVPATVGFQLTSTAGFGKGALTFCTRDVTTDTAPSERMRIDSSGNLLVGTTTNQTAVNGITTVGANPNSYQCVAQNTSGTSGSAVYKAQLSNASATTSSYFFFYATNGAGTTYTLRADGSTTFSSDQTLKKNIVDSRGYLDDLMKLRPVKYHWKAQDDNDPEKWLGLIAQEVEQVFPNLVCEDKAEEGETPTKAVKYSVLPMMMLKAIQEQQAIITQLQADVAALKAQP